MKLRTLLLCTLLAGTAHALDVVADGTVFYDCTDLRTEGALLLFKHSTGTARVRYDHLPDALLKKYFPPPLLTAIREREASEAAARRAREAELARRAEAARQLELARQAEIERKAEEARKAAAIAAAAKAASARSVTEPLTAAEYRERERQRDAAARTAPKPADHMAELIAQAQRPIRAEDSAASHHSSAQDLSPSDREAANERKQYIGLVVLSVIGFLFYFLPSFVGRQKRNAIAIFILNLFLGWTLLGWVLALVWACTREPEHAAAAR